MILEIARGSLRYVGVVGWRTGRRAGTGARTGRVETSGVEERAATVRENGEKVEGEGERERSERGYRGESRGCGFAKRGLRLGCFARAEAREGLVEALGKSAGRGEGLEVSLRSLRRVSLAPRCRPFSPVLHVCMCVYVWPLYV